MAKTSGGLGKGINALFGDIPEVDEENAENSIQMISSRQDTGNIRV